VRSVGRGFHILTIIIGHQQPLPSESGEDTQPFTPTSSTTVQKLIWALAVVFFIQ